MKQIYNYTTIFAIFLLTLFTVSCDDKIDESKVDAKGGAELRMKVDFSVSTRLAELPNPDAMTNGVIDGKDYGLKNVGLYVYYTEDYKKGVLSRPYVRNMECTVKDGELVAVLGNGANPEDARIFIYDKMTVVAFYPYNKAMNEPENHFVTKQDEERYPITKRDYSEQYYIPYRAQVETNPTISYYTPLHFLPKHTYKIELVVVSDNLEDFPNPADIKILPGIDPITNTDLEEDGKRQVWFDHINSKNNGGGGSHMRQYVGYIFTKDGEKNKNEIKRGDILLQSNKLNLIASHDVKVAEQNIYRYGYNMTTGEIFIPTSSFIIHDVPSLKSINDGDSHGYQACDIDLSVAGNWDPLHIWGGRYDGGGHKLKDMTINTSDSQAGLFGLIQGNAVVANVNLTNPKITVNSTTIDTVYVGALAARLNDVLSEADKLKLIGNLPPDLSQVVKDALIQEMLSSLLNSQSNLVACRVENPEIIVNGLAPRVGTVVGQAGNKGPEGNSKSRIWDTYSLDGTIAVNTATPADNKDGYVGGFVGLNQGLITRSFATIDQITAKVELIVGSIPQITDQFTGFGTMGQLFSPSEGGSIEKSFSTLVDGNSGVEQFASAWPSGWITYGGIWPAYYTGWLSSPSTSFWYNHGSTPSTFPILQWQRR